MAYPVGPREPVYDDDDPAYRPGPAKVQTPARPAPTTTAEYDLARLVVAAVAALVFAYAGWDLVTMRSVAGDSLAEHFYHAVGVMVWGLAVLSIAIGLRRA